MFGSQPRTRRPLLLILVFGVFLAIIGITATAQSVMVSLHFSTGTLNTVVASDSATVRAILNESVELHYLDPAVGPSESERAGVEAQLTALIRPEEILRVELRRLDGTIVAASRPGLAGIAMDPGAAASAASGQPSVAIVPSAEAGAGPGELGSPTILREFLPIKTEDEVRAVIGIWRDAVPVLERLDRVRRDIVAVTLTAAIIAAMLLFLIFRSAQGRLTRQTAALVEATRRDPLTDTLNHGALVAHLAAEIERARADGSPLGVALIDIDNFRLLNDNHGHRAGDLGPPGRRRGASASPARVGRDGSLRPRRVPVHRPRRCRRRDGARRRSPPDRPRRSEPPVRRDGAAAGHGQRRPLHLPGARVVGHTPAGGGGEHARRGESLRRRHRQSGRFRPRPANAVTSGFDVLHGLVLAVDTKDRYTKRHSEDVARYGVFLARRLGLDPELIGSIHVAGLLHDVGKIGIPDPILRKPGKLTAAEYDIVKQHVALGDMIVRDVPDIEIVRAGIRHHHERWDGDGYLDRLEGEGIPLIARILAVGDAFSAMTTTRPYRKALDLREALTRLEDAAGSQLDENLVKVFVEGIETAADAPLPGADVPSVALWTPRRVA